MFDLFIEKIWNKQKNINENFQLKYEWKYMNYLLKLEYNFEALETLFYYYYQDFKWIEC